MYDKSTKPNSDFSKLQDTLETLYGPAVTQGLIDRLQRDDRPAKAPDYMDVKAMSELQERFRAGAMNAVWRLKEWRKTQNAKPAVQQNLIQLEGVVLERHCKDAVALYRLGSKTYFAMYRDALAAFSAPNAVSTFASIRIAGGQS